MLNGVLWMPKSSSSYQWKYLHQGGRYDATSGLSHFRNRDYSATLGRWVQPDPVGYVDGMSLYEYVKSNPMNGTDPMGLQTAQDGGPCCPNCMERWQQRRAKALENLKNRGAGLVGAGAGTVGGAGALVWGICASNPIGWIGGAVLTVASVGTAAYESRVASNSYREEMKSADGALANCRGKTCKR